MTTVTISLPDSLKAFIDSQIANKGYGDAGDYVRSLLQEARAKDENARLEALMLEGLGSRRVPLDDKFRKGLEEKVDRAIEKHEVRALATMPEAGPPKHTGNPALRGLRSWHIKGFDELRVYYLVRPPLLE